MTIVVAERPKSRKSSGALTSRRTSREYFIGGAFTEIDATAALAAHVAPIAVLDGLVLDSPDVTEIAPGFFDGTVNWITPARKEQQEKQEEQQAQEPGDQPVLAFDTTGGTVHLSHDYGTNVYGDDAPDPNHAIGLTQDGTIQGVDVPAPALSWTEQHTFERADVTWSYIRDLRRLTGSINNEQFRGFEIGEVRFLGATIQGQGEKYVLTFKFESSLSEDNVDAAGITVARKVGWDYLWILFRDAVDTAAKSRTKKAAGAYVSRVSKRRHFADLGIGEAEVPL